MQRCQGEDERARPRGRQRAGKGGWAQWPQDRPVQELGGRSSQRQLPRGDGGEDAEGDGRSGEEVLWESQQQKQRPRVTHLFDDAQPGLLRYPRPAPDTHTCRTGGSEGGAGHLPPLIYSGHSI